MIPSEVNNFSFFLFLCNLQIYFVVVVYSFSYLLERCREKSRWKGQRRRESETHQQYCITAHKTFPLQPENLIMAKVLGHINIYTQPGTSQNVLYNIFCILNMHYYIGMKSFSKNFNIFTPLVVMIIRVQPSSGYKKIHIRVR